MPAKFVFISHATRNDARVEELRHQEIKRKIASCDAFLVFLTQDAMNSAWVQKEIRHALLRSGRLGMLAPDRNRP
jgi:hypothetical protein